MPDWRMTYMNGMNCIVNMHLKIGALSIDKQIDTSIQPTIEFIHF